MVMGGRDVSCAHLHFLRPSFICNENEAWSRTSGVRVDGARHERAKPSGPDAARPPRPGSPDGLRGFDMFRILGMEEVAADLARANRAPWARFIAAQLDHAP